MNMRRRSRISLPVLNGSKANANNLFVYSFLYMRRKESLVFRVELGIPLPVIGSDPFATRPRLAVTLHRFLMPVARLSTTPSLAYHLPIIIRDEISDDVRVAIVLVRVHVECRVERVSRAIPCRPLGILLSIGRNLVLSLQQVPYPTCHKEESSSNLRPERQHESRTATFALCPRHPVPPHTRNVPFEKDRRTEEDVYISREFGGMGGFTNPPEVRLFVSVHEEKRIPCISCGAGDTTSSHWQ